jgi:hypothetical protein
MVFNFSSSYFQSMGFAIWAALYLHLALVQFFHSCIWAAMALRSGFKETRVSLFRNMGWCLTSGPPTLGRHQGNCHVISNQDCALFCGVVHIVLYTKKTQGIYRN